MDNDTMGSTTDIDSFAESRPMNDEELTKLHESTLQMFRSNKIGPKNAFDIVLIDYLPAIFEATTFDDDRINHFQSVGTTLETSAKIYAARIDSLYSETRKAQSILRSTNEGIYRMLDDEENNEDNNNDDEHFSERRISNNKKIRLLMKRKKSVVTDRNKLLRKNRNDDFRPIMVNQFFLSAMHNDSILLSELYDKMNVLSTPSTYENKMNVKPEQNDPLSSSLSSTDFSSDSLSIETTNLSMMSSDHELSLSSDLNTTIKSSQLPSPASLSLSSMMNLSSTPIRSRTNSLSSNVSILTNAANLLTDTPDEYSYLDSTKVSAFINEINNNQTKLDDVMMSPLKFIRKRRLSIEYPFPFLVEQAKKQRMTQKKLQEQLLAQNLLLRPPSPEYAFSPFDYANDLSSNSNEAFSLSSPTSNSLAESTLLNSSLVSKRQRAIDFRHLQTKMQQVIFGHFDTDSTISFSGIYSNIHQDDSQQISSSDIGICFAALLNNAVRYQLVLTSSDMRDDISVSLPTFNNKT